MIDPEILCMALLIYLCTCLVSSFQFLSCIISHFPQVTIAFLVGLILLVVWCRKKIALMNKLKESLDDMEVGPIIRPEKTSDEPKNNSGAKTVKFNPHVIVIEIWK